MTVKILQSLWNDECFGLFWAKVTVAADHMEVDEPQLPRQHKRPKRYELGSFEGSFHSTPKDYDHQHYFEAIDVIITLLIANSTSKAMKFITSLKNFF